MIILKNEMLTAQIDLHGAELCSLRRGDREYLWGAYPEYWKRHSPVLFPIVGSVWNGEYRSKGKAYIMGQHGIARDMDFSLISATDTEAWLELSSTEETMEKYPYQFVLKIGYKLHCNSIEVCWNVENPSCEDLFFQIGAHPAFYWPMLSNDAINSGVNAMEKELSVDKKRGFFKFDIEKPFTSTPMCPKNTEVINLYMIGQKGCIDSKCCNDLQLFNNVLPIDTKLFDKDALIIKKPKIKAVTLCDNNFKEYLTLKSCTPLVGLWSPPGKNAPFVCIEPWYGRADDAYYDGDFENKPYINRLAPNSNFNANYEIVIHD